MVHQGGGLPGSSLRDHQRENDQVLWYIWQRRAEGDDRVRASKTGYVYPGDAIEGRSEVGGSINLFVRPDGLSASEA